jgi:hypothetical protein
VGTGRCLARTWRSEAALVLRLRHERGLPHVSLAAPSRRRWTRPKASSQPAQILDRGSARRDGDERFALRW